GAELELEAVDPGGGLLAHVADRGVDSAERHRDVERIALLEAAAEERRDRLPGALSENVPAGDVDGALRERVAAERPVHRLVHQRELAGVDPDQAGCELPEGRPRAL